MQYKPENRGDYKHSTVFASYTCIISLYGAIRFTLSGYSRSIELSIKDSICKKMTLNCSGDGLASQHVCVRILSKDHSQQLLKAQSCRQLSHANKKAHFCVKSPNPQDGGPWDTVRWLIVNDLHGFYHRVGQR